MGASNKRKKQIYGNCQVYSKKGNLMNLCLEERANWYLDRGLAVKKSDNPLTIQLLFDPKKEGNAGDNYYLSPKNNICVKCGADDLQQLTKHHIVPQMYRKFFPEKIKSRNSFDVCPLCIDDHEIYERYAESAAVAARAVLNHGDKMPQERKEKCLDLLKEYYNKTDISSEDIQSLSSIFPSSKNITKTHAEIVMSQITDYQVFVEMWREHFLKYVQPTFMPEHWNIKRSIIRD